MLTPLRDILRRSARLLGVENALYLAEVQARWPQIVGPALAAASEPRAIRGGVLEVVAAHAVAAQEIRLREDHLLAQVREALPEVDVRRVGVMIREGAGRRRASP